MHQTEGIVMRYAIIGAGNIGTAVARQFVRTGIEVGLAASRGIDAVRPVAERIGPQVTPVDVADALDADVVILAVPFEAVRELVGRVPDWQGRIVVDATNAIDYSDFSPADLGGRASSDLVGEWATGARVVKAFGHTWAKVLAREPGDGHGGKRVLFVSGNDPSANDEIAQLISRFGFDPVDLGRNSEGGLLAQFGGPLTTKSLVSQAISGAGPAEMDLVAP
ncbi:NADPH-dependent F420 reductase [Mycobacterium sp. 236(2023)]|uniref:NADPH-dependent F420 reductase n=1 Tax=Mycobacterium sp. 236(2023) TaxID=3038163 RepID=UPI002414EAE1|nr:NADPH-dependent F420 reductase [Mycobacterium sp. 236(2023)]MDG4666495.1 NADPH-dependent F420 reductase [Mycobacterium sp. 236(2023)]